MGGAQSKKQRKEKRKRRKNSLIQEIPRSASVDVIRTMSVAPSLSSCPQCQHSLSWSESVGVSLKHLPYHHRCLHGQYEAMRVGGAGSESCPNCYSTSHQISGHLPSTPRPLMTESQSDHGSMCLNQNALQTNSGRLRNTLSNDLELSQLLEILEQQKEKRPTICSDERMFSSRTSVSTCASLSNSITSKSPPRKLQSASENQTAVQEDKFRVLDDEESKASRWLKRKQMAQQLRDLRKHLEDEEYSRIPTPLLPDRNENNLCEDNDRLDMSIIEAADRQNIQSPNASLSSIDAQSATDSPTRRPPRSKFSRMSNYRYLDSHPVMTRLQNEQNNRLESMERRMKEIRLSAMQEAERRKFAEIFPAKNNDSETQKMLQEAKETLEKLKEEKRRKMQFVQGQQSSQGLRLQSSQFWLDNGSLNSRENSPIPHDSGEIIPVCVVPQQEGKSSLTKFRGIMGHREKSKEVDKSNKTFWPKSDWPEINLNQPLTWLLLPFLLFPLILRMLLSLIINTNTTALGERMAGNSPTGSVERNRRRSSDSIPGISRLGSKKRS